MCLSLVIPECGKNFQVSATAIVRGLQNLVIGTDVYVAPLVVINAITKIELSSEVMIGFGSVLVSGNHTRLNSSFRFGASSPSPIYVGMGSWIGANTTVTAGAYIGSGSCIAANCCVVGRCDNDSVYAGSPSKKVKVFHD